MPGTCINPAVELRSGANRAQKAAHEIAVQNAFNALTLDDMIDIFNVLRFPKSHFLMTQKIFEELKTRYIPANNIAQNLAVVNETRRLLSEYEQGLIALPITNTGFSGTVQPLMNNPIWAIPVAALAGAAPAGGAGPPAAPAVIGNPEKIPSHTFIAHHDTEIGLPATSQGFLRIAEVYHDNFGLNPQITTSIEDLVTTLAGTATHIDRLRIVSHFGGRALAATGNGIIFFHFLMVSNV